MKQVVILAGGKGSRLQERLGQLPKPMVPIAGIPLLERQILLVKKYRFDHILLLINYQAATIADFCKHQTGIRITLLDDGASQQGTAGALLSAYPYLEAEFLVMYGDTMLEVDLDRFYAFHTHHAAEVTLFLHPNDHPQDSDLIEIDQHKRIIALHPYPHQPEHFYPNLVNAALYWVRKEALATWRTMTTPCDIAKHLFPRMLKQGQLLYGYRSPEYIKDIGTPQRLDKVNVDFISGKIKQASLAVPQPAVFIDRDGTINREVSYISRPEDFELLPCAASAIRRLNHTFYRTVVITNQSIIARGECTEAELAKIHHKMETLLGHENAYLDHIYICPHHPVSGFPNERIDLKIACHCRKPNIGLIEKAERELHISLADSWLIGDTTSDMLTARRAGLRSIGVMTGHACLDRKYLTTPDYETADLATAVDFILNQYPILCQTVEPLLNTMKTATTIVIGGLAKSGKTTFAHVLRDLLRKSGQKVAVISLDCWLKNIEQRDKGVLNRYDIATLETVMNQINHRYHQSVDLSLPYYDKLNRQQIENADTLTLTADMTVIIEGVISLLIPKIRTIAPHKIFISCDEVIRKKRIVAEYSRRGNTTEEITSLYETRQQEETPLVLSSKHDADLIIEWTHPFA